MKKYGMPYKGSKEKLAERIIDLLPEADTLIDAFGGGGAITDCAARSGKWKQVIYNELEPVVFKGFKMAVNGEFANKKRWISREEFQQLKDSDPYAAICFSFGCNLTNYAYSPEIERFKRHLHYMAYSKTPVEAMRHWSDFVNEFDKVRQDIDRISANAFALCEECGVEPARKPTGELDPAKIKHDVFRVKSGKIREYFRKALAESGKTLSDVDRYLGNQMSGHYFRASQWALPTAENYEKMRDIIPGLTVPWSELSASLESLESLQRLESLQSLESLESLESLQSLQRLESLESLESLQSLQRLQSFNINCINTSYEQIQADSGAVIYCDPPYNSTDEYKTDFDSEAFHAWARKQRCPVYISELSMPEDFAIVGEWDHWYTLGTRNCKRITEKLFANKAGIKRLKERGQHEQLTFGG